MKNVLAILLFVSGCSYGVDSNLSIPLNLSNQDDWVWTSASLASSFWSDHGVAFEVGPTGNITYHIGKIAPIGDESPIGEWHQTGYLKGEVRLIPELSQDEAGAACVHAHEWGHALGMQHVDEGFSLMSPHLMQEPNGDCCWSQLDQNEFCRVQPQLCK